MDYNNNNNKNSMGGLIDICLMVMVVNDGVDDHNSSLCWWEVCMCVCKCV